MLFNAFSYIKLAYYIGGSLVVALVENIFYDHAIIYFVAS